MGGVVAGGLADCNLRDISPLANDDHSDGQEADDRSRHDVGDDPGGGDEPGDDNGGHGGDDGPTHQAEN